MIDIFDCDGVLVDSSHRYRNLPTGSIDLAYWIANNTPEKVMQDELLPTVADYRQSLNDSSRFTIVATARQCAAHDFDFFRSKLGFPQHFIYRKPGDTREDWKLKLAGIRPLLNLKQFRNRAVTLWEDNPVTIENFRRIFPHWNYRYIQSNQGA